MPSTRSWLPLSLLLLTSATVLGLIIEYTTWLTAADEAIATGMSGLDHPWAHPVDTEFWYRFSAVLAAVFSSTGGMIILTVTVLVLLVLRQPARAVTVTVMILGSWWSSLALKHLIDRPRPDGVTGWSQSYPSGHVVLVTSAMITAFVLARSYSALVRDLIVVGGVLLVVLVALTRVIAGAHYLTDTIGSVLWGSGAAVMISGLVPVFVATVVPRLPARLVGPGDAPVPRSVPGRPDGFGSTESGREGR